MQVKDDNEPMQQVKRTRETDEQEKVAQCHQVKITFTKRLAEPLQESSEDEKNDMETTIYCHCWLTRGGCGAYTL